MTSPAEPPVRVGRDLQIRRCRAADLAVWEAVPPSEGFSQARFDRSERGDSVFLLGWLDGAPVAQAEVLLTGCAAPEVREALGIVTEIKGVEVLPSHRRRGIGSAVIAHACALIAQRGLPQAGLGVAADEPDLATLYRRLGFTDAAVPYVARLAWTDRDGQPREYADACTFLVRRWA